MSDAGPAPAALGVAAGASWVAWSILCPLAAAALTFLLGRRAARLSVAMLLALPIPAIGVAWEVWSGGSRRHPVGGWGAPLGIDLVADGLSAAMLLLVALVGAGIGLHAAIASHGEDRENRLAFWPLWFFLWASLNALFLSADGFNLYVTMEVMGLSAVALVTVNGGRVALAAGMRYLLAALLGSLLYLFGVALLYAACGALDLEEAGRRLSPGPAAWAALCLIGGGLMLKTALFPLHFWLPAAHASAPTPVSAILSGLVVKASFYVLLRLWYTTFAAVVTPAAGAVLGVLGSGAVLWGSLLALSQKRLKRMVAYSTVAQIGYLFLLFPLAPPEAGTPGDSGAAALAWSGGIYHLLSHACAKAAMFLAAGNLIVCVGHDRIEGLAGAGEHRPASLFAFGLAGISLIGLPPSGGFVAKWLLMQAALAAGQWWWSLPLLAGGLLAAGYVFVVLRQAFVPGKQAPSPKPPARGAELTALLLAGLSIALGLLPAPALALLREGFPFLGGAPPEAGP